MRKRGTMLVVLFVALSGCSSAKSEFQGAWKPGYGDEDGKTLTFPDDQPILVFQGDAVTLNRRGEKRDMTFRLGPVAEGLIPIDFLPAGGGNPLPGICRFDGDGALRILWTKEPGGPRPPEDALPPQNKGGGLKCQKGQIGYLLYKASNRAIALSHL